MLWLRQSIEKERDRQRESGERESVCPCVHVWGLWVGQSRTDSHRGLSNTLHSTLVLLWRTCGTNIKENTGFSWRGYKRTTRTYYIPTGPQFDSLTFCSASSRVGQCGRFRFDVNTLQCSLWTYHWFPVVHYSLTPITAQMWSTGQVNHSGIEIVLYWRTIVVICYSVNTAVYSVCMW